MSASRFPFEDDGGGIPWAFLVFLLPVLARLGRVLLEKLGLLQPSPEVEAEGAPRTRPRPQRADEDEGSAQWERLARGEVPAEPARSLPVPSARASTSLESESEPEPLAVFGAPADAREPSEVPEVSLERAASAAVSLESEQAPEPLAAFARASTGSAAPTAARGARGLRLLQGDLRRAMLLSEILGRPLSDRSPS